MKAILFIVSFYLLFIFPVSVNAQTYTHPTVGISNTYAGSCMTSTCSGTYYDNGGAGFNYANSVNNIYRVFCPSTAGMCMQVTFTSIDMHNSNCIPGNVPCDVLNIQNGPTQNSTVIAQINYGDDGTTPTITSTDQSGCLGFRFASSSSNNAPGWVATLSCVPCAAPSGAGQTSNADCVNATPICGDAVITSVTTGPGIVSESCTGCTAGGENYSNWYQIQISSSGTLGLTIDPAQGNDDFDFALYGPGTGCGALGNPIRCSYSAATNNTGMGNGAGDVSEDVTGDGWVSTLNVTAGQTYYLMVNHWTPPSQAYSLYWNLTNGASLDCVILPVELLNFNCMAVNGHIELDWSTATELNNDYFILEKSNNGIDFTELVRVPGGMNSNVERKYLAVDNLPFDGENYYKLTQVDYDGNRKELKLISCYNSKIEEYQIDRINVFDLSGKLILQKKYDGYSELEDFYNQLNILPGLYLIQQIDKSENARLQTFYKLAY